MAERLGARMADAPLLGWSEVANWARHVQGDQASATWRALNPDYSEFAGTLKTNALLADMFDLYVRSHRRRSSAVPEYPRPWRRPKTSTYGSAVPVETIDSWYA